VIHFEGYICDAIGYRDGVTRAKPSVGAELGNSGVCEYMCYVSMPVCFYE
jgi:alanine racemase